MNKSTKIPLVVTGYIIPLGKSLNELMYNWKCIKIIFFKGLTGGKIENYILKLNHVNKPMTTEFFKFSIHQRLMVKVIN